MVGAGISRLGLVDGDNVETSNLHRQVMHTEARTGVNKAESGAIACKAINSKLQVEVYKQFMSVDNALELVKSYDVVLDASDNVATRYMVNDACVLAKKPLVSGSALRLEGQLTVYNFKGGPCYRCIFPNPPPPETVTDCSDGGVMGPVPGVIGTLQALEAIKIAIGKSAEEVMAGRMLLYSALTCSFRNVRLRPRNSSCAICGDDPELTAVIAVNAPGPGYCPANSKQGEDLPAGNSVTCQEYADIRKKGVKHVLLDVRDRTQFDMLHLNGAINLPLAELDKEGTKLEDFCSDAESVYVICRRGIFSRQATFKLLEMKERGIFVSDSALGQGKVKNVCGGLVSWAKSVDDSCPTY